MYDREHRFFASALVVSLVACVAFAAALGLAPSQKAYADEPTRASGYTEVQLLEYINTNMEALLQGLGMYGENTSQSHPTFRWLYTTMQQIASWVFQIYVKMDDIQDNVQYAFNRLTDIRAALVADTIEINGQVQTTVRNYARLAAEHTDSMTTILQAWNRDMGASQNGTATDATWFSTVSSRLLATVNAINSANTNLISIDSKFWEYFLVPQRWQQQDGSYYYSPAYYFQYLKLQYDQMQSYLLTGNQITVDGTNYRTPHFYLDKLYDFVQNIDYYVPKIFTDMELLVKFMSKDTVTIDGNSVNTPAYYLRLIQTNTLNIKRNDDMIVALLSRDTVTINDSTVKTPYYYIRHAFTHEDNSMSLAMWLKKIYQALTQNYVINPFDNSVNDVTLRYYMQRVADSIGVSNNGWNNPINESTINNFRLSWNSFTTMVHDYLDSLVYLLETPDSSTSQQLIGDFDDEAYAQNMQDLRQQLGQVGVFSAVTSLGMIVYTISDADSLQTPSLDVPFEFAGSNDHLVIDLSWLDDFKPMINFACMALLFLQLSAWTVEAVKET